MEWPFNTKCLPLKRSGEECYDDYECEMDQKCWYPSALHSRNQTKMCMKAFGLSDGEEIGYIEEYHSDLKHKNFMLNGKVCESMFAVPVDTYRGKCASFRSEDSADCKPYGISNLKKVTLNKCNYVYN